MTVNKSHHLLVFKGRWPLLKWCIQGTSRLGASTYKSRGRFSILQKSY